MRVLLDTHVLLWLAADPRRLSPRARKTLGDGRNTLMVSAVSLAEIVIKARAGRLAFATTVSAFLSLATAEYGLSLLPLMPAHSLRMERIPALHGDPFDRLLVAQAVEEGLPFVSGDAAVSAYPVEIVW